MDVGLDRVAFGCDSRDELERRVTRPGRIHPSTSTAVRSIGKDL